MNKSIASSKNRLSSRKLKRAIFYWVMLIFPLLQFAVFYIGVNANTILLAFQEYDIMTNTNTFVGFKNFEQIINDLTSLEFMGAAVRNSLIVYFVSLLGVALSILFSYYIYKGAFLGELFKVLLFLPNIISGLIISIMFKYFTDRGIPAVWELLFNKEIEGLISNLDTVFPTLLFYSVWFGFGVSVLIYSGTMKSISESVVDAGKIDGVSFSQELFYITIPMIWPTLVTFITVGVSGIFLNQMALYNFFGDSAEYRLYTFGYYLYRAIKIATLPKYNYLSAMGLMLTLVAVPLTFLVKWAMEKFGPSFD